MLRLIKNVLVICTGNSCRSVMAEALINQLGEGRCKAVSAGSSPAGYVHPKAIETLQRHGFKAVDARSKSWDEFANQAFDVVITVCDQAASESCPIFTGQYEKKHWSTPDPAKAQGADSAIDKAFDEALLMLKERIERELL
jgi:arsenate reductase